MDVCPRGRQAQRNNTQHTYDCSLSMRFVMTILWWGFYLHYSDVTWEWWCLKTPITWPHNQNVFADNIHVEIENMYIYTVDPLHSRALAHNRAPLFTQPCPHCSHSRAPGEQWPRLCVFTLQGCVQAAWLCRGSPVFMDLLVREIHWRLMWKAIPIAWLHRVCETWTTNGGLLANICWHKQPISRGQPDILMSLW